MTNPPAHWSTRVDKRLLSKYLNTCLWTKLWRHAAGWGVRIIAIYLIAGRGVSSHHRVAEFHRR